MTNWESQERQLPD